MHARPLDDTTLDPMHAAVVDAVSVADRRREDAGERSWTRRAEPHELCSPGGPCVNALLIAVVVIGPGMRLRRAIAFEVAA